MYSYGLVRFMQAKQLQSKATIDMFLSDQGITDFNSKHHHRVNSYIQNNWERFAQFVDKALKDGKLKGKRVKLNHYYDEQKKHRERVKEELKDLNSKDKMVINYIKRYDCLLHMSKTQSFFATKGFTLPKNQEGESKLARRIPKIKFIAESEFCEEFFEYLKKQNMKKTLVIQEDDCAPDAFQCFSQEFENNFGYKFQEWKNMAKKSSPDNDYTVIYTLNNVQAERSAEDPFWKVFKILND